MVIVTLKFSKSNQLKRILQYHLSFSIGNNGSWHLHFKATKKVSQLRFSHWHFLTRRGNHLLLGRRLFQQFMVTVHGKIETERLQYLRRELRVLRADNHRELHDATAS